MSWYRPSDVGYSLRRQLADIGLGARLFVRLLLLFGPAFRRFGLIRDQIHFLGNYSLAIIAVSGLFVGFVFGLQGYYTLQRYGSSEALGLLVTLTLVRELGPVVTALLFAGRAGTSLTSEIGLMKAGEQISVMEMMAVDPVQRILAPRFWAGVITMPLLAAVFSLVISLPFARPLAVDRHDLILLLIFGFVQLGIGLAIFSVGAARTPATDVALISMLEPIMGPIWVWIFMSEYPGVPALIGGTAVLVALAVHTLYAASRSA